MANWGMVHRIWHHRLDSEVSDFFVGLGDALDQMTDNGEFRPRYRPCAVDDDLVLLASVESSNYYIHAGTSRPVRVIVGVLLNPSKYVGVLVTNRTRLKTMLTRLTISRKSSSHRRLNWPTQHTSK